MAFQKGNAGRPVGSKNKRLALLRSSDLELQKKVLEMALAGDLGAMKVIADRIWPRLRAQAEFVKIDIESDDLAEQGRSVIDAALRGEVSADAARDLIAGLFGQAKIIELAEFEQRLKQLEQHRTAPPWEVASPKPEIRLITDQEKLPMRGNKRKRLRK